MDDKPTEKGRPNSTNNQITAYPKIEEGVKMQER